MRRRVSLSIVLSLTLVLGLSAGLASAGGGGTLVIGDGVADGEIGGARVASAAWSGSAWPEPGAGNFAPYPFCADVEFFIAGDMGGERRQVLEFPLAELPAGATITSATLGLLSDGVPTGTLLVSGYAGNGTIDNADAVSGPTTLQFPGIPTGTTSELDVTSEMSAAMVTSGWAGFVLRGGFDRTVHGPDGYATVHRLVCPAFQQIQPTLTIAFEVAGQPPASTLPDAATPVPDPIQPISVLGFGLVLVAALGGMAMVSARRSR